MTRPYRRYDGGPTRICSRCAESKPLDEFRLDSMGRVRSHCKPCMREVSQEWRARHRVELAERRRSRYRALRTAGLSSYEASEGR